MVAISLKNWSQPSALIWAQSPNLDPLGDMRRQYCIKSIRIWILTGGCQILTIGERDEQKIAPPMVKIWHSPPPMVKIQIAFDMELPPHFPWPKWSKFSSNFCFNFWGWWHYLLYKNGVILSECVIRLFWRAHQVRAHPLLSFAVVPSPHYIIGKER